MIYDRVQETTATSGTGPVSLAGATTGFQTFVAGVGDGNECYYAIVDSVTGDWEIGSGTVTDSTTDSLSRDTVLQSSNAGSLVNFAANTKDVFVTYPSEKALVLDGSGDLQLGSADVVTSGTVDGRDVSTDGTKLDGVEALADVTDAANVATAGAIMASTMDAKGDLLAATADNTVGRLIVGTNDQVLTADSGEASGVKWTTPTVGDVVGPGSATNNAVARFDTTTGKLLQDSGVTVDDNGTINISGGIQASIITKTTTYPATIDDHTILCDATSAAFTVTLPAVATSTGTILQIKKTDSSANAVTIDGNASETIDGATTQILSTQWDCLTIQCNGTSWYII